MPRHDRDFLDLEAKLEKLAELLGADKGWLHFGVKPEMDRNEQRVHFLASDGAQDVVRGLLRLSGAVCGVPADTGRPQEHVHFTAILKGTSYQIHVALARETSDAVYEVLLPREFAEVKIVVVVPRKGDRHEYVELKGSLIDEHKTRKSGQYALTINRLDGGRYVVGGDPVSRIRSFAELV